MLVHDLTLTRQDLIARCSFAPKTVFGAKKAFALPTKATCRRPLNSLLTDTTLIPNNNGSVCTLYQGRARRCRISVSSKEHKSVFLCAQSAEVSLCFSVTALCCMCSVDSTIFPCVSNILCIFQSAVITRLVKR